MSEEPRYGVVTCGKPAPEPFHILGGCIHEPGHEDKCRFKPPHIPLNGYLEVGEVTECPSPFDTDPVIQKYRRYLRNNLRVSLACTGVLVCLAVYQLLAAFDVI